VATARAINRLLRLRQQEEEHARTALESALAELARLVEVQRAAVDRERRGRLLVLGSIHTGELHDRLAGLEEARTARMLWSSMSPMFEAAEEEVENLRALYIAKRVERRQVETLIEAATTKEAYHASRRAQEALDDGHCARTQRSASALRLSRGAPVQGPMLSET
jgi:flagellar biosynthesis chaperone FliJ